MTKKKLIAAGLLTAVLSIAPVLKGGNLKMANELKIGWAKTDVTPKGPCLLAGQMFRRLALSVQDPVTATALALESGKEKVIMISLDNVRFSQLLMDAVREKVAKTTGVPAMNIIGFVTHTHTAPKYEGKIDGEIDEIRKKHPDFVDCKQYLEFLTEKLSSAAREAWEKRAPGKIAYGLGSAAVGECRRLVVKDQGGVMYAPEETPGLLHAEGHVDHTLGVMATYTPSGKLTGIIVNVACPSQVSEALSAISADFWNEVRQEVAARWGKEIFILPQCSAAGDMSPHLILNRKADERMMRLRGQLKEPVKDWTWSSRAFNSEYALARRKEIARRIAVALEDVLGVIGQTADGCPAFKHTVKDLLLPPRLVTKAEYEAAVTTVDQIRETMKQNGQQHSGLLQWNLRVVERYKNPPKPVSMELHAIRVGNAVFVTNTFELYLDYGDRIKGGSKAEQTFLIQLAANKQATYLPSQRSGTTGYGSAAGSSLVYSEGGEIIVQESIKAIEALFK